MEQSDKQKGKLRNMVGEGRTLAGRDLGGGADRGTAQLKCNWFVTEH